MPVGSRHIAGARALAAAALLAVSARGYPVRAEGSAPRGGSGRGEASPSPVDGARLLSGLGSQSPSGVQIPPPPPHARPEGPGSRAGAFALCAALRAPLAPHQHTTAGPVVRRASLVRGGGRPSAHVGARLCVGVVAGDSAGPGRRGYTRQVPFAGRAPVAQRIEHLTTDQKVGGSNPFGRTLLRRHREAGSRSTRGPASCSQVPVGLAADGPGSAVRADPSASTCALQW